ncbi:MAG: peptidylprolyl isomerase [Humibacter sp.]
MRTAPARRVPALVAAAALVALALTGCTSASSSSSCVQPGDASSQVKVSGDVNSPKATFPTPLDSSTLQKSVIHQGKGETISDGQLVVGQLTYYEGKTGTAFGAPAEADIVAGPDTGSNSTVDGLQRAMSCNTVGSRIAITGRANEFLADPTQAGLTNDTTLVFVMDLKKAYPSRADGAPRPAQPGMPTVVLAPNGQPGIKIPSHDAPKSLASAVLKQGSGATVTKKDLLLVNYTAVAWSSPDTVASSSWTNGSPVVWPDTTGQSYSPPASVLKELVGKQVGSQIIVVTPGSSATAFVIDILGIWK